MPAIQVSRAMRLAVQTLFAAELNDAIAAACTEFGATAFTIDFDAPGKTYFQGPWTLETLVQYQAVDFPCLVLYGSGSANQHREKPRTFSGDVVIEGTVWLESSPDEQDMESLPEAVESALYTVIEGSNLPLAESSIVRIPPVWVGGAEEEDGVSEGGFVQGVQFTFTFEHDS